MIFTERNNELIFNIENNDDKVVRDFVLAKCRLIMLELFLIESKKVV